MWPADTCGKCERSTPALAKITCPGCGMVACKHCMGSASMVAAASKCRYCIRQMPEYKALESTL
jgi:hypothetical protein